MNEKDTQTMKDHSITCESKNVYLYKGFKYDRLEDAVRYAQIDTKRVRELDDPA